MKSYAYQMPDALKELVKEST